MGKLLNYFAYGSNLHPARLRARVPSAAVLGAAALTGFSLRFHKIGTDGSAKCDAFYTGDSGDVVHGVVYRMVQEEVPVLDQCETLGRGYDKVHLPVTIDRKVHDVFLYVAGTGYIDERLRPFDWYKAFVAHGARFHGLPHAYVNAIEAVMDRPDPDAARQARHKAILSRMN